MENDQLSLDLQKIIGTDEINYGQGSEYFILKNNITSNLSNLPKLIQFLTVYQNNIRHLMTIFILIRDTLEKRGCLLNLENLQLINDLFFTTIDPLIPEIAISQISPICCDISAYIYRFIFEIAIDQHPSFDPVFKLIANDQEPNVILGLKMMISVVEMMKKPMKHIPFTTRNNEIYKAFENFQISVYFKVATEKAFNLNPLITPVALDLLIVIFKSLKIKQVSNENDDKEQFEFDFEIPKEMFQFYVNLNFIQNVFHVFQETRSATAIDVISYFLSVSKCAWNSIGISPIFFINSIENGLIQILQNPENTEKVNFSVTNLIYKLGKLISISQMDNNEVELTPTFIPAIQQFSLLSFQSISILYNSCHNLLRFWKILFNNRVFIQKNISILPEIFSSIFQSFINALIESISPGMSYEEFTEKYQNLDELIEDITSLVIICQICIEPSTQFIADIVHFHLNELATNDSTILLRLSMIVLIITSFFNGPIDKIIRENGQSISLFSICFQLIFETINRTDQIQPNMISVYGPNSTIFELALIQFSSLFLKKFMTKSTQILYSEDILQVIKFDKQTFFEFIFDRLLKDLMLFISFPDTAVSILSFLNNSLSNNSSLSELLYANEMFRLLISHQLLIGVDMVQEPVKFKKIASNLNQFFLSAISYDQLCDFLLFFDKKFANFSLNNFASSGEIFILYRELNGLLKGSTSKDKYTFVYRWMLHRHSEHIFQCIKAQSKELTVIKEIMRVWLNLSIGKDLNLPSYSSEGLEIIKITLQLLNEIYANVPKDDDINFLMVKILAASITSKWANFGIMKMYGDTSIDQIVLSMFNMIKIWPFESYSKFNNFLVLISNVFDSILKFSPEMIQNDDIFPVVLNFYLRSFIDLKSIQSEYSNKYSDIYSNFSKMLKFFIQNQLFQIWSNFRPHLIALLNTLFDTNSFTVNQIESSIFYLAKFDQEYVMHVFQSICAAFDESLQNELSQMFQLTIQILNENSRPNKKTKAHFDKLANFIRKYAIELNNMAEFAPFFN